MPDNKPQLHVSALNTLEFCGTQYEFIYMKKMRRAPGIAMIVGTATDRSVTKNLQNKIEKKVLLPQEEVLQAARDAFSAEWDKGATLTKEEQSTGLEKVKGLAIDKAVRLSALHHADVAPIIQPSHVQRELVVELPGMAFDLAGTLDIQEGAYSVRDTKTSGRSKSQSEVDNALQLTAYAFAVKVHDGFIPENLFFDTLVDLKKPKADIKKTTRTEEDFAAFLARVENAEKIIKKGAFTPVKQGDPLCSPRFCGFYDICPYVSKRAVSEVVEIEL